MRKIFILLVLLFTAIAARSQELYPLTQPASTLPKNTLGVKAFYEGYDESGTMRNIFNLRLMYGLTSRLTVMATGILSNYHGKYLPFDFILHDHSGGGSSASTSTPQTGIYYPYIYDGTNFYAQYRFLSSDDQNLHFRMAAYGEAAYINVPSHETEPDLSLHTSGAGGGIRATYLRKHLAVTATTGFIIPFTYNGPTFDQYGGQYPTTIRYGNAVNYGVSLGYLLFPRHYSSYNQTNWNIYLELMGKSYSAAKVYQQDGIVTYYLPSTISLLKAGSYVDAAPGIQWIIRSNTRIDLSVTLPFINRSYTHLYPFYMLGIQRYFYL